MKTLGFQSFLYTPRQSLEEFFRLNEGFSDIWGASVEHWAEPNKQTWLMGEDIVIVNPGYLRSLSDPKSSMPGEGTVDTYHGVNWSYSTNASIYAHNNMSVLTYWFYLLSVGKDGTNDFKNTYWVNGIGIDEAQQIVFRGEKYLFPSATYADARNEMINAAIVLYSTSSCELVNVTNAWYAVGVGSPFHYSNIFITGPQTASTSNTTFTFNSCSYVSSISWTHSDNLVYVSGQGTDNYTVRAVSCSLSEMGWVKAIVNSGYGNDTLERNVWVGVPSTPTIISPYPKVGLNSLIEVNAVGPGADSYNWSVGGGTITSGQGTSDIWILTSSSCLYDLTIRLTTSNACGNSAEAIKSIPFDCSGGITPLSVSPNPASQTITVELKDTQATKTPEIADKEFTVKLLNSYYKPVYQKRLKAKRFTINVSRYRAGIYYLQVTKGSKVYSKKVIIMH